MIYPDIPAHAPTPLPNPTRSPRTGAFAFNQSVAKHILYFPPLRESFKNRSLPFVIPDERLTSRLVFHSSASTVKGADLAMSRSALGEWATTAGQRSCWLREGKAFLLKSSHYKGFHELLPLLRCLFSALNRC